jgi:hypothetical protein
VGDRASGATTVDWVRTGSYEIDLAGTRYPVTVGLRPPFDPEGHKLARESRK